MFKIKKVFTGILFMLLILVLFSCKNTTNNSSSTEASVDETTTDNLDMEETTESTKETVNSVSTKEVTPINVISADGSRDTDKSTFIEIKLSKELADRFDFLPYIKVEPLLNFTASKVHDSIILKGGFSADNKYKVTVLKGIKAYDGAETKEEKTFEITFDQKKPKIMFTSEGIILPSINEKKVYIRTMNVTKINLIVRKVFANNTTQFLNYFDFVGNGVYRGNFYELNEGYYDEYDDYYYGSTIDGNFALVGEELYNVDYDIENEVDTWVQTAIDLSNVLDANGIYMVYASFDEKGTPYDFGDEYSWSYLNRNAKINKTILLTDIGMMAEKNDDGIRVNVLNILDNRLMRGVKVYLMSRNNQILEEQTTDTDGTVNFGNHKNSFYVLAETVNNRSILMLKNELSKNGFSVDGEFVSNGINGYIYTERGVYRPGDPIYVSIIVRNNGKSLLDNQPITISVYDPTGAKFIDKDVITDGKNGFYTYKFDTNISARTGIWKLEATVGDTVFNKEISVETVVPNKIKVTLNMPEVANYNDSAEGWSISSNYLFGEPSGNLDYEVGFSIREEPIDFPKYKDYIFKDDTTYIYNKSKYLSGKLGSDGIAMLTPDFSDVEFGSLNMLVDVSGKVYDDGNRPVTTKKYLKLKKYDTYIGIENVNTYRRPGSKFDIKAICVTEDGENLVAGKKIKYRVYGSDYHWWWDYSNYDKYIRSFKSDKNTTLMHEGEFVSKDVPYLIEDMIPNAEYIYLELEDAETGQVTGINLQSSEWADPSVTKKIETLNVTSDKKTYSVGDTAQIKFKAIKGSKALITIEKAGKIVDQYAKDVNSDEVIEELKITKDMTPNVYVYVTLIQDYKTKENDRPLRLYGIIPINVVDEDTKIDLQIDAPKQIRPNEKFTVKIKNNKLKKVDFTVAVVDEGLLDITAFKTPSPWQHFYKKLASKLSIYDNYSEIIDKPYGAVNQILKVGGDESLLDELARRRRLKELGLEDADRFKPVSMFKGVTTTNENGEAEVTFDMPNYMGSVRIMAVAANDDSYGSAEANMLVKAPIIVLPTLPRKLKTNDKISVPVSVFAVEDGVGDVQVDYTFKGKTQTKNVTLNKGDKQILYFDDEIGDEVGNEKVTISVKSSIYNYEETVGMAVDCNRPYSEINKNVELKDKNTTTFNNDTEFVKGTMYGKLTISNKMLLGIDNRLKYLIRYPYGCAEQTTSSVFPQLYIDDLSNDIKFNKTEIIDNINAGIERLKTFQLSDGSFSYWPGNKDTSEYATNYIGYFLICARKKGYFVPDSMYDGFIEYTKNRVRRIKIESEHDIDYKCFSLYLLALAGKANVSEMNYMYENHINTFMSLTSKMYLAASYKLAGEIKTAKELANGINLKTISDWYDNKYARDRYYYNYSYGSKLRDIAVYLNCYYTIFDYKDNDAFEEVLTNMRSNNWYSTQTVAYSLITLSNIATDNVKEKISGTVNIDGNVTPYSTTSHFDMDINPDNKNITISPETDGMTFVNFYAEGVPVNDEVKDYSEGFSLQRAYYTNSGDLLNVEKVKSGDSFWMEVVVFAQTTNHDDVKNIALTQILPTGWEIENTRLNATNLPEWIKKLAGRSKVTYTDIRDDRVMWFFDHDSKNADVGESFLVKINAVTKGEFDMPGTTLEAMYDNNYRALLNGMRVKVE